MDRTLLKLFINVKSVRLSDAFSFCFFVNEWRLLLTLEYKKTTHPRAGRLLFGSPTEKLLRIKNATQD